MSYKTAWRVYLVGTPEREGGVGGTYFFNELLAKEYLAHLEEVSSGWYWDMEKIVIYEEETTSTS